jgi:outer membrane protein OmpA-like peptidoglycan-associated protein
MALSKKRADAVKTRLEAQGIAADRIATKGFGESNPVASNDTAEGKAQNRRIEVKINK